MRARAANLIIIQARYTMAECQLLLSRPRALLCSADEFTNERNSAAPRLGGCVSGLTPQLPRQLADVEERGTVFSLYTCVYRKAVLSARARARMFRIILFLDTYIHIHIKERSMHKDPRAENSASAYEFVPVTRSALAS